MPSPAHIAHKTPVVAIIGGGASGCLVATQLLRQAKAPLHVRLLERMTGLGRGVAYGTEFAGHLLNVPAGRMGAFPEATDHFLRWAAARRGQPGVPDQVGAGDFLPRRLYGDYLQAVLAEAQAGAGAGVVLEAIKGEVTDLEPERDGVRLRCGDGRAFFADQVVLALGNLPGEYPIRRPLPIYHTPFYVHVPWRPGALAGIPPASEVLVVGAGLTAIDLLLELTAHGHRGVIHALSRRGLQPQAHRAAEPYRDFMAGRPFPSTVRALTRWVRTEIRRAAEAGIDWRPVLDALRSYSPGLWQALSWEERARFMRHVRPFWEVHRHRVAPPVAARIAELQAAGRVVFHGGRLTQLTEKDGGVEARFRLRHHGRIKTVQVSRVINCTGPRSDYSKYQHPLLVNLLARGLIDHDPLALGVRATPEGGVLSYRGGPVGWLHTIGAPLKGDLWECTAIPEIRAQAKQLAAVLLAGSPRDAVGSLVSPEVPAGDYPPAGF